MLNIKNRKMHNFCINRGSLIDVDAAIYTLLINLHELCHTSFKQTSILHRKIYCSKNYYCTDDHKVAKFL